VTSSARCATTAAAASRAGWSCSPAGVAPPCCDQHQDEFQADFLRLAGDPKPWQPEAVTVVSDGWCSGRALRRWHELMARQVLNSAQLAVLWTLASGRRTRTLPADNT
jgi:hypothetical protein